MSRLVLISLFAGTFAPTSAAATPNVVVIVADDLGWGDISTHAGLWETPNIDRLFSQGCELSRFYVHPVCTPTRLSLMTGKNANTAFGVVDTADVRFDDHFELPEEENTLGEMFIAAGYETYFVGKWHIGEISPSRHGFEVLRVMYGSSADYFTRQRKYGERIDWFTEDQNWEGESVDEPGYTTELIGDQAVAALEAAKPGQPMYVHVAFTAIHTPLQAPEEWLDAVDAKPNPSPQDYTGAMILSLDHEIGRILAAAPPDTLVFFTSDNGPRRHASSGRLRGDKGQLWEGGIRSPAAVWWPERIAAGSRHDRLQSDADLMTALATLLSWQAPPERIAPDDFFPPRDFHGVIHKNGGRCVIEDSGGGHRWKLLVDYPQPGDEFLFDLVQNPREDQSDNLRKTKPEVRRRLMRQLPHLP